jgi:hypothetical protein
LAIIGGKAKVRHAEENLRVRGFKGVGSGPYGRRGVLSESGAGEREAADERQGSDVRDRA